MASRKKGKRYDVVAPELGSIGLKQTGGFIREEFLRELQGTKGAKTYREMNDNSAVIGAALNAIEMLARQVTWEMVPPFEATDEEKKRTDRVQTALHDLTVPWTEVIASNLSMLTYGFAPHEIVFKVCEGENDNPVKSSKYKDGMIAWAKLPLRPQETIYRWDLGPNGETLGLYQRAPYDLKGGERYIPSWKFLNFRPKAAGGNPEGRSVLRNAYFPWYFAKRIQELEGIGIERDLAGLPVFQIPAECMLSTASADLAAVYESAKDIVQNVRNDSEAGLVIPSAIQDGQQLYKFSLMSTGGQKAVDTNTIIERLERRMAQVLLADFILLGHEGVGSFALSSDKTQLFATALGGWLDAIADLYNLQAIPQLMRVNGWPADRAPKLKHGDLEKQDIARWGDFVNKMVGANIITADDNLELEARKIAEIPPRDPNSPKREPPQATNTKPFGGAPDKGKPPEVNPKKKQSALETVAQVHHDLLNFTSGARNSGNETVLEALSIARAAVERPEPSHTFNILPSPAPDVTVEAPPAPNVTVEAPPPANVSVTTPEPVIHNEVTVQTFGKKIMKFIRNAQGVFTGAEIEEKE